MHRFSRRSVTLSLLAAPALLTLSRPLHAAKHQILIKDFAYFPDFLDARLHDRIEFINRDRTPHTATATFKRWDTGTLARDESATILIASRGDHSYYCRPHKQMRGIIRVWHE